MVRKMPCFARAPKSASMSSVTVIREFGAIVMSEWKEVMTQPSSACAGTANTNERASVVHAAPINLMGSPYIAKSSDADPARHTKPGDHRPRRPRQDHARRRAPETEPYVPRKPGSWLPDHGYERPRAREGDHDPGQEHVDPPWRRDDQHHRHAGPRRLWRRGGARAEHGGRLPAPGRRRRGPDATDALCPAQGVRGRAADHRRHQQGRPSARAAEGNVGQGARPVPRAR